ncbi:hypothetical protein OV760_27330, partial [Salmonella enterica subsp. enterica serovar 1,4,[5],12:i:-]|nr:hypothetical protein [Salmonella enterica subsp. enterica serovar 1,4,[5],12:i:-]
RSEGLNFELHQLIKHTQAQMSTRTTITIMTVDPHYERSIPKEKARNTKQEKVDNVHPCIQDCQSIRQLF